MNVYIIRKGHEGPLVNYSYMRACMDTRSDCMDNVGLYAGQ